MPACSLHVCCGWAGGVHAQELLAAGLGLQAQTSAGPWSSAVHLVLVGERRFALQLMEYDPSARRGLSGTPDWLTSCAGDQQRGLQHAWRHAAMQAWVGVPAGNLKQSSSLSRAPLLSYPVRKVSYAPFVAGSASQAVQGSNELQCHNLHTTPNSASWSGWGNVPACGISRLAGQVGPGFPDRQAPVTVPSPR